MKHIKLFEQFISEMKAGDYIAYIDDKRKPGGTDKEIMNDYSLQVMNRTRAGFEIMGALEDIEAFVADYNIILDEEPRMNERVINEARMMPIAQYYKKSGFQVKAVAKEIDAIINTADFVDDSSKQKLLDLITDLVEAYNLESSVKSVQEAIDVDYWADYNTDTSGRGNKDFANKSTSFKDTFSLAVSEWNSEAEGPENRIKGSQIKQIEKLAQEFFKRAGYISVNIIHAMIAQES